MYHELDSIEKFKTVFREDNYRFLVARIAIHYLKETVSNKTELYNKVNNVLLSRQLSPISFGFIRNNS